MAVRMSGTKDRHLIRNLPSMASALLTVERRAHPDSEDRGRSTAIRDRPLTRYRTGGSEAPAGRLDRLKIERAGLAFAGLPDVVAKALADSWSDVLIPLDRARFEGKVVPAGFLLDFAVALDRVERLDRSKIFHGEFLDCRAPDWRRLLRREKDGRRSDLAPRTVNCDW